MFTSLFRGRKRDEDPKSVPIDVLLRRAPPEQVMAALMADDLSILRDRNWKDPSER